MYKNIVVVVFIGLFLTACRSDFEKCMDTELPRAERLSSELETDKELAKKLISISELSSNILGLNKDFYRWFKKNPPTHGLVVPKTDCHFSDNSCNEKIRKYLDDKSKWETTTEGKKWYKSSLNEYVRLGKKHQLLVTSSDSLGDFQNKWETMIREFVRPLSPRFNNFPYKVNFLWIPFEFEDFSEAINEAILENSKAIIEKKAIAKELATVTCNNNGLYE
jgi:hypothetical protein